MLGQFKDLETSHKLLLMQVMLQHVGQAIQLDDQPVVRDQHRHHLAVQIYFTCLDAQDVVGDIVIAAVSGR